ncbi:PREDICTED: olfactory receptor 51G2-like [Gekko japonicus]|uniref:Olfactory receptor n=1 Tax=Gekko japonicus TaxID=146911 RepID=A0ABM1K254_GEKJA|nr:PREDICTED: olfactory receptor 51G2-like [Gekko japonicus]
MGPPQVDPTAANVSFYQPSVLLMTGIPGMGKIHHRLLSIPFCLFYLVAISGNCTILFIIKRTPSLHEPMHYFLSMLAVVDLGMTMCTLPTTLGLFWFDIRAIGFDACLTQMYLIHVFSVLESSVLLAMAFDRFVAISRPLRYRAILTTATIIKIGLASLLRAVVSLLPLPFLLKRLSYCTKNSLSHSFCFHPDVMKLACTDDVTVNVLYGLVVILITAGIDSIFIVLSYVLIIRTVVSLGATGKCWKTLNTCVSHICAVLIFFIPMIGLSLLHRYGKNVPPIVSTVVAYVYLIVPPALNPIIYSVKSKPIRKAIWRLLLWKMDAV